MALLTASRVTVCLLVASLALGWPQSTLAASAVEDPQLEDAIQSGITLRKEGNDEAALDLFLKLERRSPESVRLLLHITAAAQATGRWVMAYTYLRKAAAYKNDAYYVRNRAAIKSVEDVVSQHVGQFRVIGQPRGAEVRLSGSLIGTLPLAEAVPVEVGAYTLEVSQPGFYPLRREITLNGGALSQEVVELRPNLQARATALGTGEPGLRQPTRASVSQESNFWSSRTLTWTLGGATLAAAATTGVALAVREQKASNWNDDQRCLDWQNPDRSREAVCGSERREADLAGTIALTAGIATGVFAAATVTHWLATPHGPSAREQRAQGCGIGALSVVCAGTF
jgi:PEGA domain